MEFFFFENLYVNINYVIISLDFAEANFLQPYGPHLRERKESCHMTVSQRLRHEVEQKLFNGRYGVQRKAMKISKKLVRKMSRKAVCEGLFTWKSISGFTERNNLRLLEEVTKVLQSWGFIAFQTLAYGLPAIWVEVP